MISSKKEVVRGLGASLFARTRGYFRKEIKKVRPEDYVRFTEVKGGEVVEKKDARVEDVLPVKQFNRNEEGKLLRGYDLKNRTERPVPCSPVLGPLTINNPELFTKRYKWCACGMSSKQVDSCHPAFLRHEPQRHPVQAHPVSHSRPSKPSPSLRVQTIEKSAIL